MTFQDYFDAGYDPIGLLPDSKDTREKGWNVADRPRSATPHHANGNIGLRTGVAGTAPDGILVDVDDDCPEAVKVSAVMFPPTGAIFGRADEGSVHRMYVCPGDVPDAIKLTGLGGDEDTICELRTHTKEGKALQTVVPPGCTPRKPSGNVEDVVLMSPTFSPSKGVSSVLVRFTYLKGTAVLLARHLTVTRGHDYRLALAGFLIKLGLDAREVLETGKGIIALKGDGNLQDWTTACRTSEQRRSSGHLEQDLTPFVDDARVVPHLRAWFGVKAQQHRAIVISGADMITPQVTDWLWQDYMPLGAFGLHSGRENLGKTLTALDKAAEITRGTLPGIYLGTPKRVLIAASEDDWATTIVPRLMAAGANLKLIGKVEVKVGESVQDVSLPIDLDALREYIIAAGDVALVLLDPLMSRLDGKLDTHKDASVRQALEPLARLAQDANVTVLGIIHVNKTQTNDPLTAVMGSRAFVAVARFVFATVQDPNDESQSLLGQVKCNVGAAKRETHAYSVEPVTVAQDAKGRDIIAPRVKWEAISPRSIRSYFEEAQDKATAAKKAEDLSDVMLWLSDYLEKQPGRKARAGVVIAHGTSAGHSEKKLRKAAVLLKIDIVPIPGSFPRATEWVLSATSCPVTF